MNSTKPASTKMLQMGLPTKCATSQIRYRKRSNTRIVQGPLIGPPSGPIVTKKPPSQPVIPVIPMVPVSLVKRGSTVDHENCHEKETHYHQHGGYKRACHGHCSKAKNKPVEEIKISEVIFAKNRVRLPKIPNRDFINDPKFQENVIRDLLSMAEKKKTGKSKHLIGEIKEEIFRHFRFEAKKVDSIVNYIDTILVATEKTKEEAKTTIDFMQETRDKCQRLDIQMEEFLEGVRESLNSLPKEELKMGRE